MRSRPKYFPTLFLVTWGVPGFFGVGILYWGFSPIWIPAWAWGAPLLYLIVLDIIQKPWRGRAERIAAEKRERAGHAA